MRRRAHARAGRNRPSSRARRAGGVVLGRHNSLRISTSIFATSPTISAAIASEFAESDGLHQSSLILLGLLLFVLTFFVLAGARLMLMRLETKAGK